MNVLRQLCVPEETTEKTFLFKNVIKVKIPKAKMLLEANMATFK